MILRSLNKFEDTFDGNIGKWDTKTIYIDKKKNPYMKLLLLSVIYIKVNFLKRASAMIKNRIIKPRTTE